MQFQQKTEVKIDIPHEIRNNLSYLRLLSEGIKKGRIPNSQDWEWFASLFIKIDDFIESIDSREGPTHSLKEEHLSFSSIQRDYNFFQNHSSDTEAAIKHISKEIRPVFDPTKNKIRVLDFGCRDGRFLTQLIFKTDTQNTPIQVSLLDIDQSYLDSASQAVSTFSNSPVETITSISELSERPIDLIISNHSMHYVEDLNQTITDLLDKLTSTSGKLLINLANRKNEAYCINKFCFNLHGLEYPYFTSLEYPYFTSLEYPYFTSEDVESSLKALGISYEKHPIESVFICDDTIENRKQLLLFTNNGNHPKFTNTQAMLESLNPYVIGSKIRLKLHDDLYIVRK